MNDLLVQRQALTASQQAAMFSLLHAHFAGVTLHQFDRDLEHKNWAVLLEKDGRLVGFSTLRAFETNFDGQPLAVMYSGDTIVAPDAWGSAAFPRAWIHAVHSLRAHFDGKRLVWLLLTSGYRTYRFLPVFWREFYPAVDRPTPPVWEALRQHLARQMFGAQFDPDQGIVRFQQPQRLRGALADVPSGRESDPHIAFFLQNNPGHAAGDELVCVADLADENLTPAGWRMAFGARR